MPEVKYISEMSSFVFGCSGFTNGAAPWIPFMEIFKSFRDLGPYADKFMYSRAIGHSFDDMFGDHFFAGGNDHFNICGIAAIYDIFLVNR